MGHYRYPIYIRAGSAPAVTEDPMTLDPAPRVDRPRSLPKLWQKYLDRKIQPIGNIVK